MKFLRLAVLLPVVLILPARGQFVSEQISPEKLVILPSGRWFADFGKAAFGTLIVNVKTAREDTITIHLGEKLSGPTQIDRKPEGTIRYHKVFLPVGPAAREYVVQLSPDKRNTSSPAVTLPDSFGVVLPFRYAEIDNAAGDITIEDVRQKSFFWRFDMSSSSFSSSDTILNKVWDLCKYSIKATSFAGLYIDGDRERIPYEADAYINQLSHYAVDSEYELARRTCEYFIDNPTWPTEWILHTVMLFYQDYMHTGDISLIEKYYDRLKVKTLTELAREDGLISSQSPRLTGRFMAELGFSDTTQRIRDIVDWPPAQKDTGWKLATAEGERDGYDMREINTVVNSFHYINLKIMSEFAGWLEKEEDSAWYESRAELVKNSVNTSLFSREKGIYIDGEGSEHSSLHANMFPLAFGIVPPEHRKNVTEFIKSRGMACSVYGAQFLLEGLYEAGEAGYALSLLTAASDRSWYNMIRAGSTITLEAWDIKYKPNIDWNHAWGAAPANIIVRYIWGIKPLSPGYEKVMIRPQMEGLSNSEIKVPTARGSILGRYYMMDGSRDYFFFSIPADILKALFYLPPGVRKVRINGRRQGKNESIITLMPGEHNIELIR